MARKPRRRDVTFAVTVSIDRDMTLTEAKRELKTRTNELCEHHSMLASGRQAEESDVRVRRITKWSAAK